MCRTYTSLFKHIMHKQTNKQIESPANNLNLKYFEFTIKTKIRQTQQKLMQTIKFKVKRLSRVPYTDCNTHANNQIQGEASIPCAIHIL